MRIDGRALTLSNQTNPLYARVEEHEEIPPAQRPASQPGTSPHTPAALVEHVTGYINSLGFVFSREDIANFYLSLKTKPFVIMAGISGTGKSKLIRLFAESLGANSDNKRFRMVSVKPDWNDSADLFGYFDLTGAFRPGMLAEAFREASLTSNQNQPYFICLDEMNLARIEQYLGEYLSVIESRRRADDGRMTTDVLLQGGPALGTDYEGLRIPNNVYIVGTVNMDDSAFAFSRKVLDRANTIENNEVKLDEVEFSRKKLQSISISNALLSSRCLNIQQALEVDAAYALKINSWIIRLNDILSRNNKHFGYRVRDEMVCYMLENMLSGLLDEDLAFDYQIMQKVLPTLNGSDGVLRTILIELYNYCNEDIQIADNEQYIEDAEAGVSAARYQKSAAKIISMMKGFERGFVSYW